MTAERLPSGGYFDRICSTSIGYFVARLIYRYLQAQCLWMPELPRDRLPDVLSPSSRLQTNCQTKVCANGRAAVWARHRLRDKHPVHHAVIQPHYTPKPWALGSLPSIT